MQNTGLYTVYNICQVINSVPEIELLSLKVTSGTCVFKFIRPKAGIKFVKAHFHYYYFYNLFHIIFALHAHIYDTNKQLSTGFKKIFFKNFHHYTVLIHHCRLQPVEIRGSIRSAYQQRTLQHLLHVQSARSPFVVHYICKVLFIMMNRQCMLTYAH